MVQWNVRTACYLFSSIQSCLLESKLPVRYWNYALRDSADGKKTPPNKETTRMSFEVVYGKPSLDVHHIRPSGCLVEFSPPVKELKTFEPTCVMLSFLTPSV